MYKPGGNQQRSSKWNFAFLFVWTDSAEHQLQKHWYTEIKEISVQRLKCEKSYISIWFSLYFLWVSNLMIFIFLLAQILALNQLNSVNRVSNFIKVIKILLFELNIFELNFANGLKYRILQFLLSKKRRYKSRIFYWKKHCI